MMLRCFAAMALFAWSATAQRGDAQIRAELQRVRQSVQAQPIRAVSK